MSEHTIENLQDVLSACTKGGKTILNTSITRLTAPGENYGSIMLKLDVVLRNEKDDAEEVHAVAKMIPTDEFSREMFNIQVTFKNEIAMYNVITPTLSDFQRENGVNEVVDWLPDYYGARINLGENNGTVDENAVLILENLTCKGYQMVDRLIGFDLETTQLILKDLAAFHAVPLALKLRQPKVFDEKVRSYLAPFQLPPMPNEEECYAMYIEVIQDSFKCKPFVPKIKKIFANIKTLQDKPPREPFSTVTHGDMWVNNTMVRFHNGRPASNKLIDFQVCDYQSPANDVFFFLFTSVQLSVLRDNFDDLLEFYHEQFVAHLRELKCDITPFSFPQFLEEMKAAALVETLHTIEMLCFIVFGKKGGSSKEFDPSEELDMEKVKADFNPVAKEKIWFLVHTCGTRGWLE